MSSPPEVRISDSEEVSESEDSNDSDSDEDQPLISVISSAHQHQSQPITAKDSQESVLHAESPPKSLVPLESPPLPEISNDDFTDVEADLSIGRAMVRRAMSTLEKTNDVSCLFFKALTTVQDHKVYTTQAC